MLYEINTFPWEYVDTHKSDELTDSYTQQSHSAHHFTFMFVVLLGVVVSLVAMFSVRRKRNRGYYEPLKEAEATPLNV
jgi:hypothetical protein